MFFREWGYLDLASLVQGDLWPIIRGGDGPPIQAFASSMRSWYHKVKVWDFMTLIVRCSGLLFLWLGQLALLSLSSIFISQWNANIATVHWLMQASCAQQMFISVNCNSDLVCVDTQAKEWRVPNTVSMSRFKVVWSCDHHPAIRSNEWHIHICSCPSPNVHLMSFLC